MNAATRLHVLETEYSHTVIAYVAGLPHRLECAGHDPAEVRAAGLHQLALYANEFPAYFKRFETWLEPRSYARHVAFGTYFVFMGAWVSDCGDTLPTQARLAKIHDSLPVDIREAVSAIWAWAQCTP